MIESNSKRVVTVRCIHSRHQLELMLCPVMLHGFRLDLDRPEDIVGKSRLEGRREAAFVGALDPEGTRVSLLLDVDAPVALIQEANGLAFALLPLSNIERDGESLR